MRSVKELIQGQVDYTILQVVLDVLHQQHQLTSQEWDDATRKLKERYNPPTRMLEDYHE
ncbi:hypothetical protein SORDD17_01236 [Streptococcus oralis]|uniref:Uncharacterized protein n=1 Tax=Streptococcus oralis TaxID=1303 RepID=A0A139RJX4_STROR|nr:hypothetical protein [Streptococcus oralis]KXU15059.1 hypothetical protein SORDD17_01236 [Streptococcus oralis]